MDNYKYVTETGLIVPDTAEIQAEVVAEWRSAIAADLVVDNETPQGAMIVMEVEARDSVVRNNPAVANQINPDISEGPFLDALWWLTGGKRREATKSIVYNVECRGVAGTIVPIGSQASVEATGALFEVIAPIVIAANGIGVGSFRAIDFGPIAAIAGSLNTIVDNVLGWESVTNPTSGDIGQLQESSAASRRRRRATLALQGNGTPMAVQSRLADVEGVLSHSFRENFKKFDRVIDGIPLVANSVWVCVDGGDNAAVAQALFEAKGGGCDWNGAVAVLVTDTVSGQEYEVRYDRPSEIILSIRVTARFSNVDGQTLIPSAIVQYSNGELDGEDGLIVGASASPFEFAGAINRVEPRIVVLKVELSTDLGGTWSTSTIDAAINQVIRASAANITVVPA